MVNGDRTSGVLGGTGDPGQSGSQLRVPIHHLALSDHDHDLTAAMVFHIGDERLVRQRSNSPGTDSGRMNRRGDRRLRRSDPRHQPRSKGGTDRDRPQRAMLQEPTARLISHGILQFQEPTGSSGNVRKRSHSTFRRRLTITHTKVRVRLAQPAKQYAATTNNSTTSTQIVTESNTTSQPCRKMPTAHIAKCFDEFALRLSRTPLNFGGGPRVSVLTLNGVVIRAFSPFAGSRVAAVLAGSQAGRVSHWPSCGCLGGLLARRG